MSDYIPEGIQVQILNLLSVKSLLRSRCVCKRWKKLIDSPTFLQEHLAVQKPRFLVNCMEPKWLVLDPLTLPLFDTLTVPIGDRTRLYHLFGTLHGLVCLYYLGGNVFLWNPSIRKFSSLPPPPDFHSTFYYAQHTCYGFWIDPSSKEFKIIALCFYLDDEGEAKFANGYLYSSTRHDWSVIPPSGVLKRNWIPWGEGPAIIIGGVAHWQGGFGPNAGFIMSYDFRQESFECIEMNNQKYLASDSVIPTLCLWQGALSLVYWDAKSPYRCDIYSRQQGSWVNIYGFNLSRGVLDIYCVFEGMEERGRGLGEEIQKNHMVLARTVDLSLKFNMILYDSRAGCIPLPRLFGSHIVVIHDFVESLLFPLE